MKYMGSKSRIAKYIVPIIQQCIDSNGLSVYIEPFVGGANVIDKIDCATRIGTDENRYLISLFKHLQNGGELLDEVPRELYNDVRANYHSGDYEDWLVGNVGFLASYNGRWFDGGYAQPGYEKTKYGVRYRDYYKECKRNIEKQFRDIENVLFDVCDYTMSVGIKDRDCMIYCDPPYQNVKQYANSFDFNYEKFWDVMRDWSQHHFVLISELDAPDDFDIIWQKPVSRSIKSTDKSTAVEKIFAYKYGQYLEQERRNFYV